MKKILLIALSVLGLFSPALVKSQSFTVQADTIWATVGSNTVAVPDTIVNTAGSTINIHWRVLASDFPPSWYADTALGICDNNVCRQNTGNQLWNGAFGSSFTCPYATTAHSFDLSLDFAGAVTGSYWMSVKLTDTVAGVPEDTVITFVINNVPAAVTNINSQVNDIVLYPNPARDELNIVYNANADIKNVVVYNIIGKVMMVYKVIGNSANLNLENIPSGIYFVRLTNSHGELVTTRKFTKQ